MHARAGRHESADQRYREALDLVRQIGDLSSEADILNRIGENAKQRGALAEAISYHHDALVAARHSNNARATADAHHGLGHAHHACGEPAEAEHHRQRAIALYTELDGAVADDQV